MRAHEGKQANGGATLIRHDCAPLWTYAAPLNGYCPHCERVRLWDQYTDYAALLRHPERERQRQRETETQTERESLWTSWWYSFMSLAVILFTIFAVVLSLNSICSLIRQSCACLCVCKQWKTLQYLRRQFSRVAAFTRRMSWRCLECTDPWRRLQQLKYIVWPLSKIFY